MIKKALLGFAVSIVILGLSGCHDQSDQKQDSLLVEMDVEDTWPDPINRASLDFFNFFIQVSYPELSENDLADDALKSYIFDRFTEDLALAGMAIEHGKAISDQEIDDFIQLQLTHMTFKLQTPQTQRFYRKEIRKRLLIRAFLKQEILNKVEVSEDAARAYFTEHSSEYLMEPKFCIRQIQFEKKDEAEAFRKRLSTGKTTFMEEAEALQSDIDVHELAPCLTLGSFPEAFQKTIRRLRQGSFSKVLTLEYGEKTLYHVLMLERKVQAVEYSFEETLPKIKSILEKQDIEKRLSHIKEAFFATHNIKTYPGILPFKYVPVQARRSEP